jgi:hypothetical protein
LVVRDMNLRVRVLRKILNVPKVHQNLKAC